MRANDLADLSEYSMMELLQLEVENQSIVLTENLLALEQNPTDGSRLETLMRAAHSLKGAARMVNCDAAVGVAHDLEDVFVAAQKGMLVLAPEDVDVLFRGVDLLNTIARATDQELETETFERLQKVKQFQTDLTGVRSKNPLQAVIETAGTAAAAQRSPDRVADLSSVAKVISPPSSETEEEKLKYQRFLRVTPESLNRLLALSGESLLESRRLIPLFESLRRVKRQHHELAQLFDRVHESLSQGKLDEQGENQFIEARSRLTECREHLTSRLLELEEFHRRSANLSHRLYDEALACRMRPFADGLHAFPRMVRDLARELGKSVRLEIHGSETSVDREILEKLEAPLTHLLRNALSHGVELPEIRRAAGKPAEATIRLEARHSAGNLLITVSDDGCGIDLADLRSAIIQKKLTTAGAAEQMSDIELLTFLLLPGFTMRQTVTKLSGRGVGLDAVQSIVREVRGAIRIGTEMGRGMNFQMQLPLTLSIMRALLVEIGNEPYAFPLVHINYALKISRKEIEILSGRPHFRFQGQQVGLVAANHLFGGKEGSYSGETVSIVVIGDKTNYYGVITEKFLGERELVVQPLDPRLGKIKNISAGALLDDGSPVLIVDIEDLIHSVEKSIEAGTLGITENEVGQKTRKRGKRLLVVDDSLTVRELARKLLQARGYQVEVAVDGMDGWNAVRAGDFDLIISDVDMPRMDGIEFITLIKKDASLKSIPVVIVSYKDRPEDRRRGLEAGADYYLARASFHDEALVHAVESLIGGAEE